MCAQMFASSGRSVEDGYSSLSFRTSGRSVDDIFAGGWRGVELDYCALLYCHRVQRPDNGKSSHPARAPIASTIQNSCESIVPKGRKFMVSHTEVQSHQRPKSHVILSSEIFFLREAQSQESSS